MGAQIRAPVDVDSPKTTEWYTSAPPPTAEGQKHRGFAASPAPQHSSPSGSFQRREKRAAAGGAAQGAAEVKVGLLPSKSATALPPVSRVPTAISVTLRTGVSSLPNLLISSPVGDKGHTASAARGIERRSPPRAISHLLERQSATPGCASSAAQATPTRVLHSTALSHEMLPPTAPTAVPMQKKALTRRHGVNKSHDGSAPAAQGPPPTHEAEVNAAGAGAAYRSRTASSASTRDDCSGGEQRGEGSPSMRRKTRPSNTAAPNVLCYDPVATVCRSAGCDGAGKRRVRNPRQQSMAGAPIWSQLSPGASDAPAGRHGVQGEGDAGRGSLPSFPRGVALAMPPALKRLLRASPERERGPTIRIEPSAAAIPSPLEHVPPPTRDDGRRGGSDAPPEIAYTVSTNLGSDLSVASAAYGGGVGRARRGRSCGRGCLATVVQADEPFPGLSGRGVAAAGRGRPKRADLGAQESR